MNDPNQSIKKLSTSALARSLKLGAAFAGAAAGTGLQKLGSLVGNGHPPDASALGETLASLKGLGMKVGQMMSYIDSEVPENWKRALVPLQHGAWQMSNEQCIPVVEQELGGKLDDLFERWDPNPIAGGSIGQVYRAKLANGPEVAVKVQYPGVREAVEADLRSTSILKGLSRLILKEGESAEIFREIRDRFSEECDYLSEANYQQAFRDAFEHDPVVTVPLVHWDRTTSRVLISDFAEGQKFQEFAESASPERRNRAAQTIHRFAFESLFTHHLLNCDPHPGNYLFTEDRVVFLDYGCVRRFDTELIVVWKRMVRAALERDDTEFRRSVIEMGLVKDANAYDFSAHYRVYLYLLRPWLGEGPFHLSKSFVKHTFKAMLSDNPNRMRIKMPAALLFTNRLQWGLYSVMAALDPRVDFRADMLRLLYAPGEKLPEPFTEAELRQIGVEPCP